MTNHVPFSDEPFHAVNSELQELPSVELSTLPLILKVLTIYIIRKSAFFMLYLACMIFAHANLLFTSLLENCTKSVL